MIIVSPREYRQQIDQYIFSLTEVSLKIDLVYVDDMADSADGLRAISDRITGDFIILSTDFVTDLSLGALTELHRVKAADLTILLSVGLVDDTDIELIDERRHPTMNRDEEEMMMLMMEDGKIIAKIPAPDTNQKIPTGKYLLDKYSSNVSIRNELLEMGRNIFRNDLIHICHKVSVEDSCKKLSHAMFLYFPRFKMQEYTFVPDGS